MPPFFRLGWNPLLLQVICHKNEMMECRYLFTSLLLHVSCGQKGAISSKSTPLPTHRVTFKCLKYVHTYVCFAIFFAGSQL